MIDLNPNRQECAGCHDVATGIAFIGELRFCHDSPGTTCYTEALRARRGPHAGHGDR